MMTKRNNPCTRIPLIVASLLGAVSQLLAADHFVPLYYVTENYAWTRGCAPTAAATVFSYCRNYPRALPSSSSFYGGLLGKYKIEDGNNVPAVLDILHAQMGTDVSGNTDTSAIGPAIIQTANIQGYCFQSQQGKSGLLPGHSFDDWCWGSITSEINAGRPFVWSVVSPTEGHSLAAVGYTDGQYVIVYDSNRAGLGVQYYYYKAWVYGGGDVNYTFVDTVEPSCGTNFDISQLEVGSGGSIYAGQSISIFWTQLGSSATHNASLDCSTDSGNSWAHIATVPSIRGGNGFAWQLPCGASGTGYRLAVTLLDPPGYPVASSFTNFTVLDGTPAVPQSVSASKGTYCHGVCVTWNQYVPYTQDLIYRDGTYVGVGSAGTFWDDPPDTSSHYYTVVATNICGSRSGADWGYANNTPPATPTGVSASDGTYCGCVHVAWNPVTETAWYVIYRDMNYVGQTWQTSFDDFPGDTSPHSYTVMAVSGYCDSGLSSADWGHANSSTLPPPTGLSASDGTYAGYVHVTWSYVPGATNYMIYRDGNYLTSSSSTNFDDYLGDTWPHFYNVSAQSACATSALSAGDSGYVNVGTMVPGDTWRRLTNAASPPPTGRVLETAVWTGSEMIIWGGLNGSSLNDGARYNPATDSWTAVTNSGAPTISDGSTAVWTGSEMIIWGGRSWDGSLSSAGARYNPAVNSWTAVTTWGAPAAREGHTAVWTGSEMIVWGGSGGVWYLNDGGHYDPAADTWTAVTSANAPAAREGHTAVWTGSEMIVWGGSGGVDWYLYDGGRYDPAADTWTAVTSANAPAAREGHTAVWTGSEMIVWGGFNGSYLNDGGGYDPAGDSWTALWGGGLTPRSGHTAVWTGSEMIVWGGVGSSGVLHDGFCYDPGGGGWLWSMTTSGAPAAREAHTAVWTGSEMIVWGGFNGSSLNDGARYNPIADSWTAVTTSGAPTARESHVVVWTGNEMIVWGGRFGGSGFLGSGSRFSPAANSWTAVTTNGAVAARDGHTAVWTGSEMIVWGGFNGSYLNDGGRYNPALNNWTMVTTTGAPAARDGHTAVWAGNEMIVWGGFNGSYLNDGSFYDPAGDSWTFICCSPLTPRSRHTAVWTGSEMIVWGGFNGSYLNDGSCYSQGGGWTMVPPGGAPAARDGHTAVWTGREMIVWGGFNGSYLNDGGRYVPGGGWTAVTTNGAPAARESHVAVWTGDYMLLWGGIGSAYLNDGGCYDPANDSWRAVTTNGAPVGRVGEAAVWAGSEMIVWGGLGQSGLLNDTWSYTPAVQFQLLHTCLTNSNTVMVWWPVSSACWQLQETTNLATTASLWTACSYGTNGLNCIYNESPPAGNKFYRLHRP